MPEITDQELDTARRAVQLLASIGANPEARGLLEKSMKVLDPKIETTEDQQAKLTGPLAEQLAALQKRMDDEAEARAVSDKERTDNEALGRLEASFAKLREKGLTPEGEESLKKLMVERGNPDPESAFALFEKNNPKPPAEAAGWVPDQWQYDTNAVADTKALFADPERWGDDMIGQVLLEERRKGDLDS